MSDFEANKMTKQEWEALERERAAQAVSVPVTGADGTTSTIKAFGLTKAEIAKQQEEAQQEQPAPEAPPVTTATPSGWESEKVEDPAEAAMKRASGEVTANPLLKISDSLSYPCRKRAPGHITARISKLMSDIASGVPRMPNGQPDLKKLKPETVAMFAGAPTELYEMAKSLVLPEHRADLNSRWTGVWMDPDTGVEIDLEDHEIIEAGELLPALLELLPHYSEASTPKA